MRVLSATQSAGRRQVGVVTLCMLAALAVLLPSALAAGPQVDDWQVSSIVRTVELGSVALLSDVHVIRAPFGDDVTAEPATEADVKPYYFALSTQEARHISGLEATARYGPGVIASQRAVLHVREEGPLDRIETWSDADAVATRPHLYSVKLPLHFLQRGEGETSLPELTITVTGMLVHASEALPKSIAQADSQYLLWRGSAAPVTPYGARSGRVKVKASSPTVLSYATEPALAGDQMTKSGSTITFGPFDGLPALLSAAPSDTTPSEARVHYLHNAPMLTVVESSRTAKVSHWRNRLLIDDHLWLRNDGAILKGHFSRVQHQLSTLVQRVKTHTLTNIVMQLPPAVSAVRFVDESGNVSTSNFRASPPSPSHVGTPAHLLSPTRASVLDVRPRYPLLGGWNYTCSVSWQVKLNEGWLKNVEASEPRFAIRIPFLSAVKEVAVDDATLRIVLPEGASDIAFQVPFGVEVERERTWSFLDTVGKPVIVLHKRGCSERHAGMVSVEYTLTTSEQYRKVFIALMAGVLISGFIRLLSKIDLSIKV